jgi:hypothetical protein
VLLSNTAKKLQAVGVQTVGVLASPPDQARLFFRFRPPRIRIGCDPELATHRAFGVPNVEVTPELWQAVQAAAVKELQGLGQDVPVAEAYDALGRLDGYTPTEGDLADFQRHRAQRTAQFLVDRDGIVRWAHVECAGDDLSGVDQMPSDGEVLEAARAL